MRKILLPPVMLALCFIGIVAVNYTHMATYILFSAPITYVGYALILLGVFLPAWGARLFRQHQTNILPYKDPDRIVKTGPFSFSRNPMYLGMLLVLLGVSIVYGTMLSFIFPLAYFSVANSYYIPYEESRMTEVIGDEFLAYKAQVRRWF